VEENPALAARFDIRAIPTLVLFTGGEARHRMVGVVGRKTIVAQLESLAVAA
jgi:thioredoxin 1